jgi:hypothetical protein
LHGNPNVFFGLKKSSHPRERWFAAYFYGRNLIGQKLFPHDTYYRNLQGHPKKERTAKLYWSVGMIIPNIWTKIKNVPNHQPDINWLYKLQFIPNTHWVSTI